MAGAPTGEDIAAVLAHRRYAFTDEYGLQDGVGQVLAEHYPPADLDRELLLPGCGRIDWYVGSRTAGVGVEVKLAGAASDVRRQLARYASHDRIRELVLVTARIQLSAIGGYNVGVPLFVVTVPSGLL